MRQRKQRFWAIAAAMVSVLSFCVWMAGDKAEAVSGCMIGLKSKTAVRRFEVISKVDLLAKELPPSHPFLDLANESFCQVSDAEKMPELWKRVAAKAKGSYLDLIPGLAALSRACGHTQASLRNAAFLLDYMYWNRILDLTGEEVADGLAYRDLFYEGFISGLANEVSTQQIRSEIAIENGTSSEGKSPLPSNDFLSAGAMKETEVLRLLGLALNLLSPEKRAVVEAVARALNLRQGSVVIFGTDLMKMLNDSADLKFMSEFSTYLASLRKTPKLLGEPHGGWRKALELAHGDREQVIRVLGVLASMRFWELDEVGRSLSARGTLKCEQLEALQQGAMAYFLMNELDERSALDAPDGKSLEYQFFYPPGYRTSNWKIYHWFGNAHLGCILSKLGHKSSVIKYGAKSLAQSYEFATLNLAYPARAAMGVDPRAAAIIEGHRDVEINTEGAVAGAEICSKP